MLSKKRIGVKRIGAQMNTTMGRITGPLKSRPTDWLAILWTIQSSNLRRKHVRIHENKK